MILRHTNDRVTKKHHIKPPSLESTMAMRQLSERFSKQGEIKWIKLHSEQPTRNEEKSDPERARQDQKLCNPMWLRR
jgi:hypothetical protein